MKKICLFFFIAFALVFPFTAGANPFAPSTPATDTTPVQVEIGNYLYRIPMNYFDLAPNGVNCNAEAETLLGTVPEFKPHTPEQRTASQTKVDAESVGISVLIHADFKRRDMAQIFLNKMGERLLKEHPYTKAEYPVYVLDYYYPDKTGKLSAPDDLLIGRNKKGEISTFISCGTMGGGYSSTCNQTISFNDLELEISYHREYLYQWKMIEDNVLSLFMQATVRKLDKLKPYCDQAFKLPEAIKQPAKKGN